MAITDTQIDNAIPEYGDTTPHPTQPNQALMNQLLKDVRDEALTAGDLVQVTGQSTTDVMSQKGVSDQLLGVGQTWQNVTSSRLIDTTYTNTTGRTIAVSAVGDRYLSGGGHVRLLVNGSQAMGFDSGSLGGMSTTPYDSVFGIIPPGSTYAVAANPGVVTWRELR